MSISYKRDLLDVDWAEMKNLIHLDDFDNGRTPEQLRQSFANSAGTCIAYADEHIVGTARVLSDGVCNAYLVDVWTYTPYRRQGMARTMIELLLQDLRGQHVYLQTDNTAFYQKLDFRERPTGMEKVVGEWLRND